MAVWVRSDHRTDFPAMRLFFEQSRTGFRRPVSGLNFGSGLLENAC